MFYLTRVERSLSQNSKTRFCHTVKLQLTSMDVSTEQQRVHRAVPKFADTVAEICVFVHIYMCSVVFRQTGSVQPPAPDVSVL